MGTGCLKTPFQVPSIRSQVRTFVARFPMPTLLFAGYLRDTMIMREAKEILYKLQKQNLSKERCKISFFQTGTCEAKVKKIGYR